VQHGREYEPECREPGEKPGDAVATGLRQSPLRSLVTRIG
jgi:hypothetical protein